ncbi:MAG TPA: DMT family transporter [Thermodesulfobacteriota bacterium]|nr:DMT family transporter [Thermodesulfobacteriota bacterium]
MPPSLPSNPHLPLLALMGGALSIAFAPIFVRVSEVGPLSTAFWRLLLAWPALWVWTVLERRRQPDIRCPSRSIDYLRLAAAGFFFAGDLSLWHWSLRFTPVANATLLVNYAPIWVTFGSWWLFRERIEKIFLAGLVLALLGATLIVSASFQIRLEQVGGDLLALAASFFYAGYLLSITRLRRDFSTAAIMTWSTAACTAILFLVTLLSGERIFAASASGWLVLVGLAWLSHAGGQSLITYALAHLPASFSSVTLLLQPVLAGLFAWVLLHESLGPWQVLGGLLVLVGIFLARKSAR